MPKVELSLPDGMMKKGIVGALISMACYVAMQCLVAFLVCREIVSPEMIYPAACVSAAIASFVGCLFGSGKGSGMSSAVVVTVYLALTVLIGLCTSEHGINGSGLAGVGIAMSLGGLASAFVGGTMGKSGSGRRERGRSRRRRK